MLLPLGTARGHRTRVRSARALFPCRLAWRCSKRRRWTTLPARAARGGGQDDPQDDRAAGGAFGRRDRESRRRRRVAAQRIKQTEVGDGGRPRDTTEERLRIGEL